MRWRYRIIKENDIVILYAYSREDDENLDGIIRYDKKTGKVSIVKTCSNDEKYPEVSNRAAIRHFYSVIRGGFEPEVYICCG